MIAIPDPGDPGPTTQGVTIDIRVDLTRERSYAQHVQRVLAVVGELKAVHAGGEDMQLRNPRGDLRRQPEEKHQQRRHSQLA